jgi:hypothetical protein
MPERASVVLFFVAAMVAILLAMGTTLHWFSHQVIWQRPAFLEPWISRDQLTIPLPNFWLFISLPFYDGMRAWMRYGIFVTLFASLLAGFGFRWVYMQLKKPHAARITFSIVLILVLLDLFPVTFPLTRVEGQAVDHWLASHPNSGAYAIFPIKFSLQSKAVYGSLLHDQHFLGMFPGAYLPRSFRSEWRFLRRFPDESSVEILRNRKIKTLIVDATEYGDWQITAEKNRLAGDGGDR